MRYAVILDGLVANIVLWDGESEWTPGDDCTVIDCPAPVASDAVDKNGDRVVTENPVGIGWTWNADNGFSPPVTSENQP